MITLIIFITLTLGLITSILIAAHNDRLPQINENTWKWLKLAIATIAIIVLFLIACNGRYNMQGHAFDTWIELPSFLKY